MSKSKGQVKINGLLRPGPSTGRRRLASFVRNKEGDKRYTIEEKNDFFNKKGYPRLLFLQFSIL